MTTATPLVRPTVERAGTCLDGDNCPRYHCRACGQYWLGNAPHTCGVGSTDLGPGSHRAQLQARICTWMALELEEDKDLETSTRNVLERVKAAGLAEALLEWAIGELWREHDDQVDERNHHGKANGVAKTPVAPSQTPLLGAGRTPGLSAQLAYRNEGIKVTAAAAQPPEHQAAIGVDNGIAIRQEQPAVGPGPRRVDVEQLATETALLECLYQVDGEWIRLGDLNRRQCSALELEYETAAGEARAKARLFSRLGARLREGEIVRKLWTVAQIDALMGETVGRAAPARPTY